MSLNKVQLIGNVGKDPEVRYLDSGVAVATFPLIRWLNVKLAPCISVHGVLVDVYGEGVLITGESGIGKSEAALELIRRGHRLVTDDVVELRKVSDDTLVGSAPDITKHFIELRGIGIVDVKALFGALSVKDTQTIDLVIRLEDWDKDKEYDRLGLRGVAEDDRLDKPVAEVVTDRPDAERLSLTGMVSDLRFAVGGVDCGNDFRVEESLAVHVYFHPAGRECRLG